MKLYNTSLDREYYTDEGCHIIEIINTPDNPHTSIARARIQPGITTQLHALDSTSEIYYIQSGVGLAHVGDEEIVMREGDAINIPPGVSQQITNTGEEDLIFLCVCNPRFEVENYKIVEE